MWREPSICTKTNSLASDALNLSYRSPGDMVSELLMKFGTSPCSTVANFKLPGNLANSLKNEHMLLLNLVHYVYSQNQ